MYLKPENGDVFRFVVGVRRKWLFWKKVVYSHLPVCVRVNDYKELADLSFLASKDGRTVLTELEDDFKEENDAHCFFAVRAKSDDIEHAEWYTGRWYLGDGRDKSRKKSMPETVRDIRSCQMFVREVYALEALSRLNRAGYSGVLERVYVNIENIFRQPCIVTICLNKRTRRLRYLKSYKENDHRLRYTEHVNDALLIFPEEAEKTYEHLVTSHKEISFTMVAKPNEDIPAEELKAREMELKQGFACDFFPKNYEKD